MSIPPLNKIFFAAFLAVALISPAYSDSSLIVGENVKIASQPDPASKLVFNLSLNGKYAGYQGTANIWKGNNKDTVKVDGEFGGDIVSYRLWNAIKGTKLNTYASAGSRIGDISTKGKEFGKHSPDFANVWEQTNPNGKSFSSDPDFIKNTIVMNIPDVSGSIDVSDLGKGNIYLFYGAYRTNMKLSAKMTGSKSAADIKLDQIHSEDRARGWECYMARIDIVNDDGYSKVEYEFTPDSGNGGWLGVVVTTGGEGGQSVTPIAVNEHTQPNPKPNPQPKPQPQPDKNLLPEGETQLISEDFELMPKRWAFSGGAGHYEHLGGTNFARTGEGAAELIGNDGVSTMTLKEPLKLQSRGARELLIMFDYVWNNHGRPTRTLHVDYSLDGGKTWTTADASCTSASPKGSSFVSIKNGISDNMLIRFHMDKEGGHKRDLYIDNILISAKR